MSWQSPWPTGVTATGSCAQAGINKHRLVDRPVVLGLLGELPGAVPYSTHLEIAAARARLVHQAVGQALHELGAERVDISESATSDQQRVLGPRRLPRAGGEPNADLIARGALATQTRRRRLWLIGGMVDLVV